MWSPGAMLPRPRWRQKESAATRGRAFIVRPRLFAMRGSAAFELGLDVVT
jgi:hypothetical protein